MLLRISRPMFVWIVVGMAVMLASVVSLKAYAAPMQQGCTNDAEILEESSEPAELVLAPGQSFTKSWRIRNTGDCRWTSEYSLNLADGSHMGGNYYTPVSRRVSPNATYVVTFNLLAPTIPGDYHAEWELNDADYEAFGPRLNVDVEVSEVSAEATLPDVLLLAGLGAGGGEGCWEAVPEDSEPSFQLIEYGRSADLCVFNFATGTLASAELTSPDGETFRSEQVVGDPQVDYDDTGTISTTYTLAAFGTEWLDPYPAGEWELTVTVGDSTFADTISVTEPEPQDFEGPHISHLPAGSFDPFRTTLLCAYEYRPGERVIIQGTGFPADRDLLFGIYGQRDSGEYSMFLTSIFSEIVAASADGEFNTTYDIPAGAPAGDYWVVATDDPSGAFEDMDGDGFVDVFDLAGTTCFDVGAEPLSPIFGLQLAYVSGPDGSGDIYIYNLDNGTSREFAVEACDEAAPAWWPDRNSIVYQADCRGSYDIYRTDTWAGTPRRLTTSRNYDEGEPAISPDGATLVFRRTPAGEWDSADGELVMRAIDSRELISLGVEGRAPAWSPDGTQIAYMARPDGKWQVYIYDLDDGESRLASEECPTQCGYPAWSPDGQALAYSVSRAGRRFIPDAIWIAPVDGGEPQAWQEGGVGAPAWSLGQLLAFTTQQGIEAAAEQGDAEPQLLVEEEDLRQPAWSR